MALCVNFHTLKEQSTIPSVGVTGQLTIENNGERKRQQWYLILGIDVAKAE
jgi:hypothetical protein